MATIADITAYDGQATPVAHVLKAIEASRSGGQNYALYRENLAGVPQAAQVRAEVFHSKTKAGTMVPILRVTVPVQEVVTGSNSAGYSAAPKVAHEVTYELKLFASPRATAQQRVDAFAILMNIARGQSGANTYTEGVGMGGALFHWSIPPA